MGRRVKPAKAKVEAKLPVARKSPKSGGAKLRDLEKGLAEALKRETEALEQQTATADILGVISRSPADAQPVFDAIAVNALRLCDAQGAVVVRYDGEFLHLVAQHNVNPEAVDRLKRLYPIPPGRHNPVGRAVLDGVVVQVPDFQATEEFSGSVARQFGVRGHVSIPLLHQDRAIGAIGISRPTLGPFPDRQIALLQTFAAQAVIAIENVRLFRELETRNGELTTALDQQTATSEILRVISSSPTDVQPVLDAVAENAARLCGADDAVIQRVDGGKLTVVAHFGGMPTPPEHATMPITREMAVGSAVLDRQTLHVHDLAEELRRGNYPGSRPFVERLSYRTMLYVPLVQGDAAVGVIVMRRAQVQPFTDQQIDLVKTFADQAVIAIENVRLFRELQTRNGELRVALEQQTATSEILRAITHTPTDTQPVFDTIVESAVRLCDGLFGTLWQFDGELIHQVAQHNYSSEALAEMRRIYPCRPSRAHGSARAILERAVVHISDVELDPEFQIRALSRAVGWRSGLFVPMLREGAPVGAIAVTRARPGSFSDNEIELLKTFAHQAIIAVENVRLFTELQEKNRALTEAHAQVTESLEQQTATSEVLRVISSSPTDIRPVLDTVAASSARLCEAQDTHIYLVEGEVLRLAAHYGSLRSGVVGESTLPVIRGTLNGRAVIERRVAQIADLQNEVQEFPEGAAVARRYGHRTALIVPLLRKGVAIGTISLRREEVRPFSDKQIALLETFADQAVIAIENVRLFNELQARTAALTRSVQQLTALGEVGRAVSSTLDLETVLTTIVSRAVQLAGLEAGAIYEYDEAAEVFHLRATQNLTAEFLEIARPLALPKGEGATGRLAVTREPVQIPDITAPDAYHGRMRDVLLRMGHRALLAVPLISENHIVGGLVVNRRQPGEFAPEVIELLRTFATQSALAIQNARLFREIEEKSHQLEVASQHKSEFLANMSHELRTPLNAIIGFSEVLTDRMFGELNEKQDEYLKDIYASGTHLLSLINDILDLSKIEAGRMELELTEFHLPTALDNALTLVRERAMRRSIALHMAVDPQLGQVQADERKIRQVVLNLLSNAIKFTPEGGRIEVGAVPKDGFVEVAVTDTGVGIAPEDQEAVFEEFRQVGTAEKKAEGTGLGLTLCRKFIELHGGRIWVTSEVGVGSTFTFTIPVRRRGE